MKDCKFYVRAYDVASDIHSAHIYDSLDMIDQGVLPLSIDNIAEIVLQNSNAQAHFSVDISGIAKCNGLLRIIYIVFASVSSEWLLFPQRRLVIHRNLSGYQHLDM